MLLKIFIVAIFFKPIIGSYVPYIFHKFVYSPHSSSHFPLHFSPHFPSHERFEDDYSEMDDDSQEPSPEPLAHMPAYSSMHFSPHFPPHFSSHFPPHFSSHERFEESYSEKDDASQELSPDPLEPGPTPLAPIPTPLASAPTPPATAPNYSEKANDSQESSPAALAPAPLALLTNLPPEENPEETCDAVEIDVRGVCSEDCPVGDTARDYHAIAKYGCVTNSSVLLWCCTNLTSGTLPKLYSDDEDVPERISSKKCIEFYKPVVPPTSIVRGVTALPEEFPHMAVLGFQRNDGSYDIKCGGVLIAPNFVLTAAHCTRVRGKSPGAVKVGGTNLNNASAPFLPIVEIINHPQYIRRKTYHDIALLKLGENASTLPACLWITEATYHKTVTVIGYGHTEYAGKGTADLLKANLSIYTNDFCKQFYPPDDRLDVGVIDSQLCIGDPELLRDTCQGDSGGPVILKRVYNLYEIPFVLGITSFGKGCAQGSPGIYTRVGSYVDWIESIVWPSG